MEQTGEMGENGEVRDEKVRGTREKESIRWEEIFDPLQIDNIL